MIRENYRGRTVTIKSLIVSRVRGRLPGAGPAGTQNGAGLGTRTLAHLPAGAARFCPRFPGSEAMDLNTYFYMKCFLYMEYLQVILNL